MADSIHDKVKQHIQNGDPGFAQGTINGQTISWHPGLMGGETYSGGTMQVSASEMKKLLIDATVKGNAVASPGTFSRDEYLERASYYRTRYGSPPQSDLEFADQIEAFATNLPALADFA